MKLFDLAGKAAAVTGGNGGIGLGIARGLAEAGAAIAVIGRNKEKNAAAARELKESGAKVAVIAADLSGEAAARRAIEEAAAALGRLDILVNNAGISVRKAPQDFSIAEWESVIGTNLTAAFVCAQAAYPHFRKAGGGKVINIASIASNLALPFAAPYAVSKGGLMQLTRALAVAWARDRIQVNAILPGWIDTDMTQVSRRIIPGFEEKMLDRCPAGRWGKPEDFAGIAVFLASAASDFATGAAFTLDGGYSARG